MDFSRAPNEWPKLAIRSSEDCGGRIDTGRESHNKDYILDNPAQDGGRTRTE